MEIPFLPYDEIRPIANGFLLEHNSTGKIPVDIEQIVDNIYKFDIVPIPGLHRHYDIDSFITSDFSAIHVDEYVYDSRPGRFRLSIAHELAHFLIHQDVFKQLSFSSTSEWKEVVKSIPEDKYGYLEFQANSLAGLILVPEGELERHYRLALDKAVEAGLDIDNPSDELISSIESHLAQKVFAVSSAVVHRRLEFDKLIS